MAAQIPTRCYAVSVRIDIEQSIVGNSTIEADRLYLTLKERIHSHSTFVERRKIASLLISFRAWFQHQVGSAECQIHIRAFITPY